MPSRWRWAVLLSASIAFYVALRMPLLVIAWTFVVLTTYWCGRRISDETSVIRRRYLWAGVAAQILILISIKYLRAILRLIMPGVEIPVGDTEWFSTLGISYYTLQAISYLADVYL